MWFISERLFTENVITDTEAFGILDDLLNLLIQSNNTAKINGVIQEILEQTETANHLQILRYISQHYTQLYQQCFMQLKNQYPFNHNCEFMLHKVDEYTDNLIAKSCIQSPLIDQWRETVVQKKRLQECVGAEKPSFRKKM